MMHKPIHFKEVSFSYPFKPCFNNFNALLPYGSHVAVIGRNGSGKSSLLKLLTSELKPDSGELIVSDDVVFGYVPQIIEDCMSLSGSERFQTRLTHALARDPNCLLLDEPTNHLDSEHGKSLIKMLKNYPGTLIIVTHDVSLIDSATHILWHIEEETIHIFNGNYSNYLQERNLQRNSLEAEVQQVKQQKIQLHNSLMREQERSKKSKTMGRKNIDRRKWPTVSSKTKADRANQEANQMRFQILKSKEKITSKLISLKTKEIILPKFSIQGEHQGSHCLISIRNGQLGFNQESPILTNINLDIRMGEKVLISGKNASGKSSLIKGIMNDEVIIKNGVWHAVKKEDVGYLDQHYTVLDPEKTPFELISQAAPFWSSKEIRNYLSHFLFRTNEVVLLKAKQLSGGEKCRLCLARITCKAPKLMILDEITNNIDLETKAHLSKVLENYTGALIIISHDVDFIENLGIDKQYEIIEGVLHEHL